LSTSTSDSTVSSLKGIISTHHSQLSKGALAGVIAGSVIIFLLFLLVSILCIRRSNLISQRRQRSSSKPGDSYEASIPYPLDISPHPPSTKRLNTISTSTQDTPALASPHNFPDQQLSPMYEAGLAAVVSRLVQEQLESRAPPQYETAEVVLGR
jgi:hypothetical protein